MIVTIGNPMVDYIAESTEEEVLSKGLTVGGECPEKYRGDQEGAAALLESFKSRCERVAGGASLNTARVTGWALQQKGIQKAVAAIGAVGSDSDEAFLRSECLKVSVDTSTFHCVSTAPTGRSLVLVTNGERSIVGVPASCRMLTSAAVRTCEPTLSKTKILYSTSFGLTTPERVAAVQTAKSLISSESLLVINLSSAALQSRPVVKQALIDILPSAAILIGNFNEFEAFCTAHEFSSLENARSRFPNTSFIVTNGSKQTMLFEVGKPTKLFDVPKVAFDSIVDTNGAGDAFAGGVLSSMYTMPSDFSCAIASGHSCAAVVIQRRGCELP